MPGSRKREPVHLTGIERQLQLQLDRRRFAASFIQRPGTARGKQIGDPQLQRSSAPDIPVASVEDNRQAFIVHGAYSVARTNAPRVSRNTGPRLRPAPCSRLQRPSGRIACRELLRRQELARVVEDELHRLERKRDGNRALERHTRLSMSRPYPLSNCAPTACCMTGTSTVTPTPPSPCAVTTIFFVLSTEVRTYTSSSSSFSSVPEGIKGLTLPGLDELFERQNVDRILHHAGVLERDCPRVLESPRRAPAFRRRAPR